MNVNYKNSPETGEKIGPNNIEDRLQYIYLLYVQLYIRYKKNSCGGNPKNPIKH